MVFETLYFHRSYAHTANSTIRKNLTILLNKSYAGYELARAETKVCRRAPKIAEQYANRHSNFRRT